MFITTEAFVKELNNRKIAYRAGTLEQRPKDDDDPSKVITKEVVDIRIKGDYNLEMQSRFLFDENCRSATASLLDLAKVPEEKLPEAYQMVNDLNITCRVAKYVVVPLRTKEGEKRWILSCRIDVDIDNNNAAPVCMRALDYLAKIGNRNYPTVMQQLFGRDVRAEAENGNVTEINPGAGSETAPETNNKPDGPDTL